MRLIYKRGSERISFPIDEGETYIGRKDYCELYFPDGSLSKRHAQLVRKGSRLRLYDAGSRNGTFLNGESVEDDGEELRNGDVIQCGKLRFKVEGMSEGSGSDDGFQVIPSDSARSRRSTSGRSRSRYSQPPRSRSDAGSVQRSASGRILSARAVASTETRPSMLDVLPELPPSVEGEGYEGETEAEPKAGAVLRLVEGGPPQTWELSGETMTIGSKAENAIVIQGEGVSRYHAQLVQEEGDWIVKDLGARNGVFIAGERIDMHLLKPGDEVQIGTIKLRYEVLSPSFVEAYAEAFAKFKKDPVGAFKTDQRVRMAAVALIAAIALVLMVLPRGGGGVVVGEGGVAHGHWLAEGSQRLLAGKYKEARDIFRKAKVQVPEHQSRVPQTLERIAARWMDLEKGPMRFRWKKAAELLESTPRLKGLPEDLRDWLAKQGEFTQLNLQAFDKLVDAKGMAAQAGELARQKQFESALQTYSQAQRTFDAVERRSQFAAIAAEEETRLGKEAFKLVEREIRRRMKAPNPNWAGTLELIERSRPFASESEDKQSLRRLAEQCETNRRDEAVYVAATKLINQRILAKYPDAQRLLEQIDRRSRIYPDAQAYIDWIDADMKVRHAKRAYDIGDARQAFQLLNEAMRYEVLGPEAKTSVRSRRAAWVRVVRAYERGMQLFNEGRRKEAQEEFKRVIELETNNRNRFYVRARDQIKHIDSSDKLGLDLKLKNGFAALEKGDHSAALKWFREARDDPNHRERDLQRIRVAVAKKNKERKLLDNAKQHLIRDRRDRFIELRDTFKLLTIWLPKRHKDRKEARKHLDTVLQRLKNWAAGTKGGPR